MVASLAVAANQVGSHPSLPKHAFSSSLARYKTTGGGGLRAWASVRRGGAAVVAGGGM